MDLLSVEKRHTQSQTLNVKGCLCFRRPGVATTLRQIEALTVLCQTRSSCDEREQQCPDVANNLMRGNPLRTRLHGMEGYTSFDSLQQAVSTKTCGNTLACSANTYAESWGTSYGFGNPTKAVRTLRLAHGCW